MIEVFMEKIKPVVLGEREVDYSKKSTLIALFSVSTLSRVQSKTKTHLERWKQFFEKNYLHQILTVLTGVKTFWFLQRPSIQVEEKAF